VSSEIVATRWRSRPPGSLRDPTALTDAIERLVRDPDLRACMAAAGRRRAVEVFGPGPHVAAFEVLYERFVG